MFSLKNKNFYFFDKKSTKANNGQSKKAITSLRKSKNKIPFSNFPEK